MAPNQYRKVYRQPDFKLREVNKCSVCQQFKHQQAWYFDKCWECHVNPRPAPPVEDVDLHAKFKEFLEKTILEKMGNPDNPIPVFQENKKATVIQKKAKPPMSIEEMKASSQKKVNLNDIRKCAACQMFKHDENWNVDICSDCSINGNCSSAVQNSPPPDSQDSSEDDIAKKLPEFLMELVTLGAMSSQNLIEQLKKSSASPEIIKVSPTTVVAEEKVEKVLSPPSKKDTGIIKIIGKEREPQEWVTCGNFLCKQLVTGRKRRHPGSKEWLCMKCYNFHNKNKVDRDPQDFKPKHRKIAKLSDEEMFNQEFMEFAVSRDYTKYIYESCSRHTEWEQFLKDLDRDPSSSKWPSVPPPTSNGMPFDIKSLLKGSEASKMIMEAGSPQEVMDSLQVATVLANMGSFSSPARSPVSLVDLTGSPGPVSPGSSPVSSNSSPSPVSSPLRAPTMRSPVLTPIATQTDGTDADSSPATVPLVNPMTSLSAMASVPILAPGILPNTIMTVKMNEMAMDFYVKVQQLMKTHRGG